VLPDHYAWLFVLETLVIVGYLVAVIAFTRPPATVIVGAVAGIAPVLVYQLIFDPVVARHDLFRFAGHRSRPPLLTYPQTLLAFTMVGILGHYLWRRFGVRVLVWFGVIGLLMPLRDLAFANTTHWIEFGPGVWPWVIDGVGNAAAMVLPVLTTRPRSSAANGP
jgi:hypothetical protein